MGLAGGEAARGYVDAGKSCMVGCFGDGHQKIVCTAVQQGVVEDHARGNDPDNFPFDQSLGLGGIFNLFTHGHLAAFFNEFGNVKIGGLVRHPAHGNRIRVVFIPGCQRDFKDAGRLDGIPEEHLIKVPHPVKQYGVLTGFFDGQVLGHHGCLFLFGHGCSKVGRYF